MQTRYISNLPKSSSKSITQVPSSEFLKVRLPHTSRQREIYHRESGASRYQVEFCPGASFVENPFPRYAKRFFAADFHSKSSHLGRSSMWNQWIRLPGCSAVTGPSFLPPLNHELHDPDQAVRGMKVAMCSEKSLTAAGEGRIETMSSTWHFMMTLVMYLARCSVMVTTLPWPMGAFGPRKAEAVY